MKTLNKNFADLLLELENKTTTEEHFQDMLACLPPQLTNYEKGKGFDAFLVGEPYTHEFCRFAGKEVAVYACYATASNGTRLDVGNISEAAFTKYFITASQELGKKVFFGQLTKIDLLIETKILVKAGLDYYKNCDDEYLDCEQSNKGWFEICTQNGLLKYVNQLKNKIST